MPALFFRIIQTSSKIVKALFEVSSCLYFGHGLSLIAVGVGFCSIAPDEFRYFLWNLVDPLKVQKQMI